MGHWKNRWIQTPQWLLKDSCIKQAPVLSKRFWIIPWPLAYNRLELDCIRKIFLIHFWMKMKSFRDNLELSNSCSYDVDDVIGRADRFGFQNFCSPGLCLFLTPIFVCFHRKRSKKLYSNRSKWTCWLLLWSRVDIELRLYVRNSVEFFFSTVLGLCFQSEKPGTLFQWTRTALLIHMLKSSWYQMRTKVQRRKPKL